MTICKKHGIVQRAYYITMTGYKDLEDFFQRRHYRLIIAADAEPIVHKKQDDKLIFQAPAGGVSIALAPIAQASHGIFVARGKTEEDKLVTNHSGKIVVDTGKNSYTLKRLFFSDKLTYDYYYGFSNQTLWPLCHIAFERPIFTNQWYEGFKNINESYAKAILQEVKGKTFIWLNDYQLSLVPRYLGKSEDVILSLFWHIPWPTWEIFRILPQKKEILDSLLRCDFIGFHRGYQARNFLRCVERELEARIDLETNKVYYNKHITTVKNLPMGVDSDMVIKLASSETKSNTLSNLKTEAPGNDLEKLFRKHKVILGVDRLDYTKGLLHRLAAIDLFFKKYPQYKKKIIYLTIIAPSREQIPSYEALKNQMYSLINEINLKYKKDDWQPIHIVSRIFSRSEIISFYKKTTICLVTPLDDGMNLVSKEFVVTSTLVKNPGMLILSQFAGSAIDLSSAIIVNPYNLDEVASAIKKGIEMLPKEKKERMRTMAQVLEEKNSYVWAQDFIREGEIAAKENR